MKSTYLYISPHENRTGALESADHFQPNGFYQINADPVCLIKKDYFSPWFFAMLRSKCSKVGKLVEIIMKRETKNSRKILNNFHFEILKLSTFSSFKILFATWNDFCKEKLLVSFLFLRLHIHFVLCTPANR